MEELRAEGLVDARQGFGWFVADETVRQPLGRLGTHRGAARGLRPSIRSARILDFAFIKPPARVRQVLGVDKVLQVRRLNLADGHPFARVTVWCPEELGAQLSRAQVGAVLVLRAVAGRRSAARCRPSARDAASTRDAELLEIPTGSPVLVCERITSRRSTASRCCSASTCFPATCTEFIVDLPHPEASIAPSGLRLVE